MDRRRHEQQKLGETSSSLETVLDERLLHLTPGISSGMQKADALRAQMTVQSQGNAIVPPKINIEGSDGFGKKGPGTKQASRACSCKYTLSGHHAPVTALKITKDTIISASLDSTIKIWSLTTGKFLLQLDCGKPLYCFQVLEIDHKKLLILPGCDDGRVPTWKVELHPRLEARCTNLLPWHSPNPIRAMTASPDGERIATGCCFYMRQINTDGTQQRSTRGTLKLWELKKIVDSAIAPNKYLHDVGHLALKTMRQLVAPFEMRKISKMYMLGRKEQDENLGIRALAYTPDSSKILVGFGEPIDDGQTVGDKLMVLCCAKTLNSLWVVEHETHHVNGLQFINVNNGLSTRQSADQMAVLVSSQRAIGRVLLVKTEKTSSTKQGFHIHTNWIHYFKEPHFGLWTSRDENTVCTATGNTLRLWNTKSGVEVAFCEGHKDSVICADFSDDGSVMASGSLDCSVRVWRTTSQPYSGDGEHVINIQSEQVKENLSDMIRSGFLPPLRKAVSPLGSHANLKNGGTSQL